MSNGDKNYQHMVVRVDDTAGSEQWVICFDGCNPAVYADSVHAESYCAKLRANNPDCRYRVISFVVL